MTYLGFIMLKDMYLDCVIGYRKSYIYSSFIDRFRLNIAFRAFCNSKSAKMAFYIFQISESKNMTYLGFIMLKDMYLDCVIGYRKSYIYSSFIDRCRLNIAFRAFCNINGKLTKITNLALEKILFP